MSSATRRNLYMFQKLVGKDALRYVVLGTTKWRSLVDPAIGAEREEQLKKLIWKEMIDAGSRVVGIRDQNIPREIVQTILDHVKITETTIKLMIQHELVDIRKFLPDTEAGQTLKYLTDESIEFIKRKQEAKDDIPDKEVEKLQRELGRLLRTEKNLKVPLESRVKRFFL